MKYRMFVAETIGKVLKGIDHDVYFDKHNIVIFIKGASIYPKRKLRFRINLKETREIGLYKVIEQMINELEENDYTIS
jgi:hypothetical protein